MVCNYLVNELASGHVGAVQEALFLWRDGCAVVTAVMTSRAVTVLQTLNRSVILILRTVVFACSLSAVRCQSYQGREIPPPPTPSIFE